MKTPAAHILVTCTKRKRHQAPSRLCLGTVGRGHPSEVARRWVHRLDTVAVPKLPASTLYAGDHWQIAASLPAAAGGRGVVADLWILSAGYGLIPSSAPIAPYSATFSAGHPDQVASRFPEPLGLAGLREWWAALARWPGPTRDEPRTITALAQQSPSVPIVVVGSPHYLAATLDDLVSARAALSDPGKMIVISAGSRGRGDLAQNLVDCSSRLQASLGGALMSLNARVARSLIERSSPYSWSIKEFSRLLGGLATEQPADDRCARRPATDDDVCGYIRQSLRENPKARHTTLLRIYRDAGYACEQKRFRRLFQEMERTHARTH